MDEDLGRAQQLVKAGAAFIGTSAAGLLAALSQTTDSVLVGAAMQTFIQMAGDFFARGMSSIERQRVEFSYTQAILKFSQNLEEGRKPRDDGFFSPGELGWSSAKEILEGVHQKCRAEHEIKKVRYISNVFGNLSFRPDVAVEDAEVVLSLVEGLTYRQLCIYAIAQRGKEISMATAWGGVGKTRNHPEGAALVQEISALPGTHAFGNSEEPPHLTSLGLLCYELMDLEEIPLDDLKPIYDLVIRLKEIHEQEIRGTCA